MFCPSPIDSPLKLNPLKLYNFFTACTVLYLAMLLFSTAVSAQQQPNAGVLQAFSTLEAHEYDSINLATLAIQMNVPIRNKPGHIPFSYQLVGSSQVQQTVTMAARGSTTVYLTNPSLTGQEIHTAGSVHPTTTSTKACGGSQNATGYGGWIYTDPSGSVHRTSITQPLWANSACGPTSASSYAEGGIYVTVNEANGTFTATDSYGNTYDSHAGTFTDANGNVISRSPATGATPTYTDTFGQTALSLSNNSFQWTDALGNARTTTYSTTSLPLNPTFGCSGWTPEGVVNGLFPSIVSFPDGSSLSYGWETNYANNTQYTGRLASITLPTGGTISYSYSGGTNGIDCGTAHPVTVKRTTPDGTWTYTSTDGLATTATTVTDPMGNQTVYNFTYFPTVYLYGSQGIPMQTEKQVYTGSTLSQTVITCYNNTSSSPTSCGSSFTLPITEKDEYTTYPGVTGYSAVKTAYDTYGHVTDIKKYDFNATTPTSEQQIVYGTGNPSSQTCSVISTYIIGKPCSVTLLDSQHGNAILSQTWNQYDTNGNLTQTWNLVSGSGSSGTYLSKQYTYTKGVMQTSTDVNGQVMNYTTNLCNSMIASSQYPTNFSNLATSQTWDCNGGVETSSTDANSQTIQSIFYANSQADPFYRPVETEDQLGNITNLTYTPTSTDSSFSFNGGASVIETLSTTDSIGRNTISQLRQGPSSGNWDSKSRSFDGAARQYQTSLDCVAGNGSGCTASTESQTYDGLNRPLVHVGTGGDVVTKQYIANDVLTTVTPAPSGENAKATQKEYDGLGRLKSTCIISNATGSASCGQTNAATGFLTTYSYDASGKLLSTVENAQVSSPQQTRSFTYDLIGRKLTETNPESGTVYYTYDSVSGANCTSTSKGDLVQTVDANGNTACYHYDGLHRNTSITYAGPNSNGVNKYFVFDAATVNGVAMAYAEGRMAEAYTCSGSCTSKITDEGFSYDQRGQMSAFYQMSPNSGGYYLLNGSYWLDKSLKTVSGIGLPTITYGGLDGEGRPTTVTASSGSNLVSGVTYNTGGSSNEPIGALLGVTLSTQDTQTFTYDKNTGRMTQYAASVGATPVVLSGTLTWNANGTLQALNISDGYSSADTQNCTYAYDDFIRASSVNCVNGSTKVWNQSFSYGTDAFGNLTKSSTGPGLTWSPGYNTANNRYSGTGSYDANGNLLTDPYHTYTWLADGHVASIVTGGTTSSVTYDAMGNKVEENVGGVVHEYVSAFGVSAQMTGQTETSATVTLLGGVEAIYAAGSLQRFRFPDWEGTIRAESNPSTRTFTESLAFAPFGERYALKGAPFNTDSFTGKPDQLVSDEYDFAAREMQNEPGRWISPDPMSGTGNKYAYADNNPLSKIDLNGFLALLVNPTQDPENVNSGISGLDTFVTPGEGNGSSESKPANPVQTDTNTDALQFIGGVFQGAAASVSFGLIGAPSSTDSNASLAGQALGTSIIGGIGTGLIDTNGPAAGAAFFAAPATEGASLAVAAPAVAGVAAGSEMAAGAAKNGVAVAAAMGMKEGSSGGPGSGKKTTPAQRKEVLKENGGKCVVSGCNQPAQHVDHATPRSRNGDTTRENLQGMCAHHNCQKGAKTSQEFEQWLKNQN